MSDLALKLLETFSQCQCWFKKDLGSCDCVVIWLCQHGRLCECTEGEEPWLFH